MRLFLILNLAALMRLSFCNAHAQIHAVDEKLAAENKSAIDILIHIHFTNSIDNQNLTFLETMEEFLTHFDDKQMKIRIKKRANEWNFNRHNLKAVNQRKMKAEINDKLSGILSELGIV
jgi:hypothetical protein